MPKVSVIIPVYGAEKYIEKCARSLFRQSLDDIEYLFIDDCTPDKSMEVLHGVIEDYPNRKQQIVIHRMDFNSGQAAVRRWGVNNATGDFVFHCDSDDWIDEDLLSSMYTMAINEGSDVVVCDCLWTGSRFNKLVSGGRNTNSIDCVSEMMHRKMLWSLCNKLFRKELYNEILFPSGDMGEDMCICLQLMTNVRRVDYIKGQCYYYNIHDNSTVTNSDRDRILSRYYQLSDNIETINNTLSGKEKSKQWINGLNYLSFYKYEMLQPLLDDNEIRKIWKEGVKKTSLKVVIDPYALLKYRVKALLILLGYIPSHNS